MKKIKIDRIETYKIALEALSTFSMIVPAEDLKHGDADILRGLIGTLTISTLRQIPPECVEWTAPFDNKNNFKDLITVFESIKDALIVQEDKMRSYLKTESDAAIPFGGLSNVLVYREDYKEFEMLRIFKFGYEDCDGPLDWVIKLVTRSYVEMMIFMIDNLPKDHIKICQCKACDSIFFTSNSRKKYCHSICRNQAYKEAA